MAHMSYSGFLVRMGTKMHCKMFLGVLFTMSNKLYSWYKNGDENALPNNISLTYCIRYSATLSQIYRREYESACNVQQKKVIHKND